MRIWLGDRGRRGGGQRRVRHAERSEQPILKDLRQRRAFDLLDDEAEQDVVRVAVEELRAGSEHGRILERDGEQFLRGPDPARVMVEAFRKLRRVGELGQAAPHLEQVADRDVVPVRNARDILRDRIVEAQLAFLGEQHGHGGGHRLGVRGDPEMRVAGRGRRAAEFRRAVAVGEIALRGAQKDHRAREQQLLGHRVHGGLKRRRIDRLELCRGGRCSGRGARRGNQNAQDPLGHRATVVAAARRRATRQGRRTGMFSPWFGMVRDVATGAGATGVKSGPATPPDRRGRAGGAASCGHFGAIGRRHWGRRA